MRFFVLSFISLSPFFSFGQVISGKVLNESNGQPLQFCTIGIIDSDVGTLTNEKGSFTLKSKGVFTDAKLRVSMIGFQSRIFNVQALLDKENVIKLKEQLAQLKEITITAPKPKRKTLGTKSASKFIVTGWDGCGTGGERGTRIEVLTPILVEKVNFHIAYLGFDSVLFRLHIRKIEDGLPDQELLPRNIYATAKSTGWVEIPLEAFSLSYDKDIAVTVEWVAAWGTHKDHDGLKFSLSVLPGGTLYGKESTESIWTRNKHSPGIYLTVQQ